MSNILAKRVSLLLAVAALLALPAAAGAHAKAIARPRAESTLLRQINLVRREHGLHALAYDPTLARAALSHSQHMAATDTFAHGAFATRMVRFHVRGPIVGENLAWGTGSYGTARGIVDAWLKSPEHRANLLRPGYRRVGLGEVTATFLGYGGARVVTADFAGL